jgi:hypothetical protein
MTFPELTSAYLAYLSVVDQIAVWTARPSSARRTRALALLAVELTSAAATLSDDQAEAAAELGSGEQVAGQVLQGASIVSQTITNIAAGGFVNSLINVSLPAVLSDAANRVRITVTGAITTDVISTALFTLKRGATFIEPAPAIGLQTVTMHAADYVCPFAFVFYDAPGAVDINAYSLWVKTQAGNAHIGGGAGGVTPTTITVEEIEKP